MYYGLCRNGDVLCRNLYDLLVPSNDGSEAMDLPPLLVPGTLKLPLIQVQKQLHPNVGLEWRKNPNTVIVCSQPESPVVQGQTIWWCPTEERNPRLVLRESSLVVYSKESQLSTFLKPDVSSSLPFTLIVHFILEDTPDIAQKAQELAFSLQEDMDHLSHWPCVVNVQVKMQVVPAESKKFATPMEVSENNTQPMLSNLTETQVNQLFANYNNNNNNHNAPEAPSYSTTTTTIDYKELFIYIPAISVLQPTTFHVESSRGALLVVGWDVHPVHQWLANKMGIPTTYMNTDGSFPLWYEEWYWQSASFQLAEQITKDYTRMQHLLQYPLQAPSSNTSTFHNHYIAMKRFHQENILSVLYQSTVEADFPLEHYGAIFAPLIFPLLVPFLAGLIKEYRRYKDKRTSKARVVKEKEKTD